ncbi:F-box/kelch-repeat protein At3g23880-like [Rutidosis leptorrhynchoides]|uniref:F-box/kelch-repeat protein At3g23880-like n=1 Tax=Rutidosis leptorrhynchoides TaxID=125765 RepID=UPI003A993B45
MSTDSNSELIIPDTIPIEIQVEIVKHLPIKSLIRSTLLSKLFNAIIKSSSFITKHSVRHNQHHYLLARDNDNFHQNKLLSVPETVHQILEQSYLLTSYHRLLCLATCKDQSYRIWNPLIQRCIVILIPDGKLWTVGFGVCPDSFDPKLVKIKRYGNSDTSYSVNWDAEVYSVSSGVWRTQTQN